MRQTDPLLVAKIENMRAQGCTMKQIADEVGMSQGHISKILRKHASTTPNAENEAWQKPLCQCQPREIFEYLRHLGYEGKLTYKREVTI